MIDTKGIYLVLTILLAGFYICNTLRYLYWWRRLPEWSLPTKFKPQTFVSILIPARNEAINIAACLQSILSQNYPTQLIEIIVIDDFSDDLTPEIVQGFNDVRIRYLSLADFVQESDQQAYKKKAIETGINQANGSLIITTDADCQLPYNWLALLVSYYEAKNPVFIASPVNFTRENSTLERFQSLDFAGMMLVTGAGIQGKFMHLCNGANLAYPKKVFQEVDGFAGIDNLASGDDMLLLQKVAHRYPNRIGFVKSAEATALTSPMPDWRSFLSQRLRWASKSTAYREWRITLTLALVFAFCINIIFSLVSVFWWGSFGLALFLGQLFLKTLVDFVMLRRATDFFERQDLMRGYFIAQIYHIAYIAIIGLLANMQQNYVWKGRRVK
ncbi:MAG: glycosyl transferase [Saprospiraceae bacterium]|nr:MAG: glycosyl transferase [Saprospiraceae bacterium]